MMKCCIPTPQIRPPHTHPVKRCTKCLKSLPDSEYYRNSNSTTLRSICKKCFKPDPPSLQPDGSHVFRRRVRIMPQSSGVTTMVINLPRMVYEAMGKPDYIQWSVLDGEINLEVVD